MTPAYVGLGANLGDPRRQLQLALQELAELPRTRMVKASNFYRSAPVGFLDQPDFVNAVARLETELAPGDLLDSLQAIEARHGRERPFQGAPRSLDLDLLLYGDDVLATPRLTLPHPRLHERAFVLRPLVDLDPGISIPGKGKAGALLSACGAQVIERMA